MAKRSSPPIGPSMGGVMTPTQLMDALTRRYPAREYAFLEQVRNSTGFARQPSTADAIALSLWPSRGLVLHGFEIKAYRGDWRREKHQPEKAEAIAQFCDYWWLVVTRANIVDDGELPDTWGLLAPDAEGKKLVEIKAAGRLEAKPWSRGFMAAMLRNVSDAMVPRLAVEEQLARARYEELTAQGWQGDPVRIRLRDSKGGDPAEWPEDLRVREFPEVRP